MLQEDPKIALAERSRFLGIIVSETERLSRLINQILDLGKLASGRADWVRSEVDLRQIIREACDSLSQLYKDRQVAISLSVAATLPCVMADRDRMMQVMINLLSNAVKFVPPGSGHVKVGAGVTASEVRISVADNGPGIRPEDRELIFEKFRQGGHDVLTDKPQGTGLGLPISRQIVEYFGGQLWLESPPEGGATFVFTLPVPTGDNAKKQLTGGTDEQEDIDRR
jgi:signal transduction histidine kinase